MMLRPPEYSSRRVDPSSATLNIWSGGYSAWLRSRTLRTFGTTPSAALCTWLGADLARMPLPGADTKPAHPAAHAEAPSSASAALRWPCSLVLRLGPAIGAGLRVAARRSLPGDSAGSG